MAPLQWIKIDTSMFTENRKIKSIENMKNGDTYIVIWYKLLLMAGQINDRGAIYITEDIPYSTEDLADELRRPLPVVKAALDVFAKYKMIRIENGIIYLTSWDKYQSTEKADLVREQNRLRKQKERDKSRDTSREENVTRHADVTECHGEQSADVTACHAIEEEEEEEEIEYNQSIILSRARKNADFEANSDDFEPVSIETSAKLKRKYLQGQLGGGVVLLSDDQLSDLCERLSIDELNRYIGIVRDCEKAGKHYRNKSHYAAILEMAERDRRVAGG